MMARRGGVVAQGGALAPAAEKNRGDREKRGERKDWIDAEPHPSEVSPLHGAVQAYWLVSLNLKLKISWSRQRRGEKG
ncbi:hypothetical protein CDL15_Pgr010278 [Punica granatum]|uniref:Uncharacterized protein n=1 Tax=Punica granatum TaxID=22663 RepID=A0A218W1C4_PUNGR|nr:hypothetical protein CDL15_Pgr010278 [Punica granatum]